MSYFEELKKAQKTVKKTLSGKGVKQEHLTFGGHGKKPEKAPRVPTDARSEFLANRAMGDWAENLLADALRQQMPKWNISHYGNTESAAAGEEGFKELFLAGLEEVRVYGKRPDLLVFPSSIKVAQNLSTGSFDAIEKMVSKAVSSIEVRSSKFEALKYMAVRKQQKENGKSAAKDSPSFTVKVEDLVVVYRWIERTQVPQTYFQVFFDSVYAINVLDIFRLIGEWRKGLVIETPAKSQQKATIMIPITMGRQVGSITELPKFAVEHRVTELGRHDAYVRPVGGRLELDTAAVKGTILTD